MSDESNIPAGYGDDDALAAEYVLGVLDHVEREQAAARADRDPSFARRVNEWEARFSGLNSGFAEVEPPKEVKAAIDRRLFGEPAEDRSPRALKKLWESLAFWRLISGAALAGLLALAFIIVQTPDSPRLTEEDLVAYLASEESDARFIAFYDRATEELRVTRIAGDEPPGKDHELWLIAGDDPAVSLGLVGKTGQEAPSVADRLKDKFTEGVTLAVSLEPDGGSPTGQATGPVIALGPAKKF